MKTGKKFDPVKQTNFSLIPIDEEKGRPLLSTKKPMVLVYMENWDSIEDDEYIIIHNDRSVIAVRFIEGAPGRKKFKLDEIPEYLLEESAVDHLTPEEIFIMKEELDEEEKREIKFTEQTIQKAIKMTPANYYQDYDPDQQIETDPEAARIRRKLKKQNYGYSSQWEDEAEQFDLMPSIICKTGNRNISSEKKWGRVYGKKLQENNRHFFSEEKFPKTKQKNLDVRTGRKLKQQNLFSGEPSLQVSYLLGL